MSQNNIIREATNGDYPQILAIYRYYWDKHLESMPADYEKVLKYLKEAFDKRQGHFNFWVVDNGEGEIYGWISCLPVFVTPLRKEYNGELSIYIRKDKINKNIGEVLSDNVLKIIEKSPLYILWCFISPLNVASHNLAILNEFRKTELLLITTPFYPEINLWMKPLKGSIKKNTIAEII